MMKTMGGEENEDGDVDEKEDAEVEVEGQRVNRECGNAGWLITIPQNMGYDAGGSACRFVPDSQGTCM